MLTIEDEQTWSQGIFSLCKTSLRKLFLNRYIRLTEHYKCEKIDVITHTQKLPREYRPHDWKKGEDHSHIIKMSCRLPYTYLGLHSTLVPSFYKRDRNRIEDRFNGSYTNIYWQYIIWDGWKGQRRDSILLIVTKQVNTFEHEKKKLYISLLRFSSRRNTETEQKWSSTQRRLEKWTEWSDSWLYHRDPLLPVPLRKADTDTISHSE